MSILNSVISPGMEDFKCYNLLKKLFNENEQFRNIISQGIMEGKVRAFPKELWDLLDKQVIRAPGVNSFIDVFRDGANEGYCTVAAKQVSYSLPTCYICGGTVDFLIGTTNSKEGEHTWIEVGNDIIDTTFVLVIDKSFLKNLTYHEENRYDPNLDPVYLATKEFTNDSGLKR